MGNIISHRGPMPSQTAPPPRRLENGRVPHVCIVGAGMSGFRCADILLRKGVKVTIFEARDRTGGRLHQSSKLGHLVDLGPNWIHGTEHNPLVKLANETNTVTHNFGDLHSIFDCTGAYMDADAADKQTEAVWSILDDGFQYSAKHSATIPPSKSLMDYFHERVRKHKLSGEVSRNVLDHARMWGAMIGTEIERQSFKFFWLEECIDGESLFMASTYKAVMEKVAKEALKGAEVHLSTEVTHIEHHLAPTGELGHIEVEIANGTKSAFDEVVVTAPLGWIKRNKTVFAPPMPPTLSKAIDNIGYGCLEKVWITFPSTFWDGFPGETLFLRPEYAPGTNPNCWNQEMVSLAAFPPSCAQPTIMFYIYGENSKTITSAITDLDPYSDEYYDALNVFFKPYYSRLPGFSESSEDCIPKAFECTDWQHDRWAGNGSYSNFQIGLEHADSDIETYREGMGVSRGIWFAGEATAPFVALGTVTGAYWSGEAVGRRILDIYGLAGQEEVKGETEEPVVAANTILRGVKEEAQLLKD